MPTPRHLRHLPATLSPSPYHPRPHPNSPAYATRSPRSTGSPYSTATYAPHHALPPPLHTLPLYMHLAPTSCRTFSPSPQQPSPTLPHSVPPLFHTHSPRPQHLTAIFLYSFPPLFRAPSAPPSAEKFVHPRLKQAVTHLWKSFVPKEEEDLSSISYPDDIVWITL